MGEAFHSYTLLRCFQLPRYFLKSRLLEGDMLKTHAEPSRVKGMIRLSCLLLLLSLTIAQAGDWPWWRGPSRNGVAEDGQNLPTKFSATENVKWVVDLPGRGHGSPAVVGDRVFIATADKETEKQSMHCFNRATGEKVWETVVHTGGWPTKSNKKGTQASSSPAVAGDRLFINFWNDGAVHTTALSLDGKILWQTKITDYVIHQSYGTSPAIFEDLVIVSADNKSKGAICGLKQEDGSITWRVERPKMPNYASPIILEAAGKQQLLFTGCELVTSLNPSTGEKLWEVEGSTTECVTSTITDGERVFTSGGYPKNHVSAFAADGSGKLIWESKERVYVPSMFVKNGHLFAVMDAGVAVCWKSDTGEEVWKERLGGTFSASPVLVGDLAFIGNESGDVYVFRADPEKFEIVGKNKLGDEIYASPVICGGEIFQRVAVNSGQSRQEKLFCISAQ
ncbi:MAG: outer membrane protein assembly factor BamB [Verrucomicrobiales bacterium]|jgi:outer membrane protein assembly factor BamB